MSVTSWDEYAPFYDWENARTFGRRDVAFWRTLAERNRPPLLELGCGTGRVLTPLARRGLRAVGLDRSPAMMAQAVVRGRRLAARTRPAFVLGDVCALPFPNASFGVVIAAYGLLQSLLSDRDLDAALAGAARVLKPDGVMGIDLVPDLPAWKEYRDRECFKGRSRRGGRVTLIESVRQQPSRGLTIFEETFLERRGKTTTRHAFTLTFRTVSVAAITRRLERHGLRVEATYGDYRGGPITPDADAWVIVARKKS